MVGKICCKCKEEKAFSEFHKNRSNPDGLQYRCKHCRNKQNKKWNENNKDKVKLSYRKFFLKKTYNLTIKQHKEMYIKQNGCCLICGQSIPYNKVQTDHSHETGKVRGLLCIGCNIKLDWYIKQKQNIEEYLKGN